MLNGEINEVLFALKEIFFLNLSALGKADRFKYLVA